MSLPRVALGCALGCAVFALALGSRPAGAQDMQAGRHKALTVCAACHGRNGIATNPDAPNLAGDNAGYLVKQLNAFRSGARKQEQMSIIASGLSDADVANVAAWFSSLKVTVTLPPE